MRKLAKDSVKTSPPAGKLTRVGRLNASSMQANQSISIFQCIAGGDPVGGTDVCGPTAQLAEYGRPADRAWHRHLPRNGEAVVEQIGPMSAGEVWRKRMAACEGFATGAGTSTRCT